MGVTITVAVIGYIHLFVFVFFIVTSDYIYVADVSAHSHPQLVLSHPDAQGFNLPAI